MASQPHQGINTQVQRSLGKCVPDKVVGKKVQIKATTHLLLMSLCGGEKVPCSLLRNCCQFPEPALRFHNTVPIMLTHFAGGTLHPALVFSQCDHSRGGSGGQFGGSPIRKKPQRKEQSVFKLQGREHDANLFS